MQLLGYKNFSFSLFLLFGATFFSGAPVFAASEAHLAKRIGSLFFKHGHRTAEAAALYDSLELQQAGLSREAFNQAVLGYHTLQEEGRVANSSVITIIDFDQPSYRKRFYVIDMENHQLIFNTWAAHGKNTGRETARFFSNAPDSHKSSLGFYVTAGTYYGSKGYSLKLEGMEPRLNSNAMERAIVIHAAPYVSQSFINAQGYIGRSHGCPALPPELNRPIIDRIKNGSVLFVYNKSYHPTPKFQSGIFDLL